MAENPVRQTARTKILKVYEIVLRHGPILLDEVYPKTEHSRTATFRALKQLERAGWIRPLINRHQFVATSLINNLMAAGSVSLPEVDLVSALVQDIITREAMHVDIGMYVTDQTFHLLESSNKAARLNTPQYPHQSSAALVAYCISAEDRGEGPFGGGASGPDMEHFRERLKLCRQDIQRNHRFFCVDELSSTIGLRFRSNLVGALSITQKSVGTRNVSELLKCSKEIVGLLRQNGILGGIGDAPG